MTADPPTRPGSGPPPFPPVAGLFLPRPLRFPAPRAGCDGFVLVKAVIVCGILLLGSVATLRRVQGALVSAARQQQSQEARGIAEAGMESVLGELNLRYPYLLTSNHTPPSPVWSAPAMLPAAVCRGMRDISYSAMPTRGTVANLAGATIGDWEVVRYRFQGHPLYGGTGRLEVEGRRRASSDGPVLARARVEQEVSLRLKDCTPAAQHAIGLLGGSTGIGYTLVVSLDEQGNQRPGMVHCTSCTNVNPDMDVRGDLARSLFGFGFVSWPPSPLSPSGLSPWSVRLRSTDPPADRQIWAGRARTESGQPVCLVDSDRVTHCLIRGIDATGNDSATLKVIHPADATLPRQVRLYVQGDVNLRGNGSICQAIDDGSADPPCLASGQASPLVPTDFMIFGQPESSCSGGTITQKVDLRGGAQALRAFVFMPCASVSIAGGSSVPDLMGAIWSRAYLLSGSNQNVEIYVPPSLVSDLRRIYGSDFTISVRRPVAVGRNRWSSYETIP